MFTNSPVTHFFSRVRRSVSADAMAASDTTQMLIAVAMTILLM